MTNSEILNLFKNFTFNTDRESSPEEFDTLSSPDKVLENKNSEVLNFFENFTFSTVLENSPQELNTSICMSCNETLGNKKYKSIFLENFAFNVVLESFPADLIHRDFTINFWQLKTLRFCTFSKISISKNFRELNENVFFRKFRFQQCLESSPQEWNSFKISSQIFGKSKAMKLYFFKSFACDILL
jgi:hypothetical protein